MILVHTCGVSKERCALLSRELVALGFGESFRDQLIGMVDPFCNQGGADGSVEDDCVPVFFVHVIARIYAGVLLA